MENQSEAVQFLNCLFQNVTDEGNIDFRFKDKDGRVFDEFVGVNTNPDEIENLVKKHLDKNVWYGVNLRNGCNGKKEGVSSIVALHVEIDNLIPSTNSKLNGFLRPTITVQTSLPTHQQCLWVLKEPLEKDRIADVEDINKRLLEYFGGDKGTHDASRVLRLPGTFNIKPEYGSPMPVKILEMNPQAQYELEDFEILPKIKESPKPDPIEFDTSPELWKQAEREIVKHPRIMLRWLNPKPNDRSGHDWGLACLCLEEGITDPGTLYQIILNNPHGKARSYPDTDRYIRELVSRAINQSGITQSDSTEFPFSIVSGVAGDFADLYFQYIESPKEYLFIGLLTCLGSILAGKVSVKSELRFDTRIYGLFVGESATERKSSSLEAPIGFFREFFPDVLQVCWSVGSAEGLRTRLKDTKEGRLLLAIDEMDGFVSKCKVQGSVLLQATNSLFEQTHFEHVTKDSNIKVPNARLSILGATTKAVYDRMWDEKFIRHGFVNRIFLVPGSSKPRFPVPQKIPIKEKEALAKRIAKILSQVGNNLEMEISEEALAVFSEWYFTLRQEDTEHVKRIDTYALRFMPLLALNDGKKEIDLETTQKAITLMNWQKNVREIFDPIDSTNEVARTEEKIRRLLKRTDLSTRDLKRNLHIDRVGVWFFDKAVGNLSGGIDKEIQFNHETKKWTLT